MSSNTDPRSDSRLDAARFDVVADDTLQALLRALDGVDDLEAELSQGVLTITFEAGGPAYVVNSHRAAGQIWMAADRNAWHFDPDAQGARWTASKPPHEDLWAALEGALARRLGRAVTLR